MTELIETSKIRHSSVGWSPVHRMFNNLEQAEPQPSLGRRVFWTAARLERSDSRADRSWLSSRSNRTTLTTLADLTAILLLDECKAVLYTLSMINSFVHKRLEAFFRTGSKKGIQIAHSGKLRLQLAALNQANSPNDLNAPGWRLHELKGDLRGHHSITVNGNWRVIFRFVGPDIELVNYLDYH